jgi:excisionase family DNA binding protein
MADTMMHKKAIEDKGARLGMPSFLTTEEVLTYLKVTPRTIYRLIRTGELPAVRVGRQWRFRQHDLDAWIDRQANPGVVATLNTPAAITRRATGGK